MAELDDGAETALVILKRWQWACYDPDGKFIGSTIELNEVVNRLAFQGLDDPAKAVLSLLCEGRLTAVCYYQWLKYRRNQRFQRNEFSGNLDKDKWQMLAKMLVEVERSLAEGECSILKTDLAELEMGDCETVEWQPQYNRCSYAICPPDTDKFEANYFEESFSASGIEVMLAASEYGAFENPYSSDEVEDSAPECVRDTKTPLSEADLTKWWDSKANVRELLTKDELLTLVRSKHPDKHISRERVRDLIGARKRGPKGFSGKSSAK